ncbi:N-succinylarginine dihydrolase [Pacificimonas sp. WHA3]|uniref:N-succinylarginine dihydrolase n=1 Tax=Pacificimonas pallii TaxID=2827236 RepID=A0ABS6SB30_9SPHN|nr:N-succinylarginine dihydrolase [Pacificimonas pallii]MBV7255614.1 N-succinylarginine dihydrolase [Pacificimonas pallii]
MTIHEINFDGLIGPTHNYAGLSLGNLASATNAGNTARPRAAALQGLRKMRLLTSLGLKQGFFLPHQRPNVDWLRGMGFTGGDAEVCAAAHAEDPALFRNALSASAMWTANAATVSAAADTADGRVHVTPANLSAMTHRTLEWRETANQLAVIFADRTHFAVHDPVPPHFGDEGAANFMRLAPSHGEAGVEIQVYGEDRGGRFPARQSRRASEAVMRKHGVADAIFTAQSTVAIEAGAFHNDVVAVANETVLFAHEQAFDDRKWLYEEVERRVDGVAIVEVPANQVSLEDAISSYLFNSQLVTLPHGQMSLILPTECEENPRVKSWLDANVGGNGPIHQAHFIDVRESMRNGGGPACLRLRVAVSEAACAAIDDRFLLDEAKADRLERLVETHWPEEIAPADLASPDLWQAAWAARAALKAELGLG